MAKNNSFLITKPEIKFWLAILGLVVGGVVAFTTLKMEVRAMAEEREILRKFGFERLEVVEKKVDILIETTQGIEVGLAEVRSDLGHIKEVLE